MDGLLLDSERLFQKAWRELAAEYGVTLDTRFPLEMSGTSRESSYEVIRRWFPGAEPASFHAEGVRRVVEMEKDGIPLKPGVLEILEGLRGAGFRCAVGSSSPEDMVLHNLRVTGIEGYFDAVVAGEHVKNGKPAPDIFLLAAERLGFPTAECYVFEDSHAGIHAGHDAGCRAILIPDVLPPTDAIRPLCAGIFDSLSLAWEAIRAGQV